MNRAYACAPSLATGLPSPPQRTVNLPGRVPRRQVLTLVVGPLAAGERQLDLGLAVLEVQGQRNQRQATLGGLRWRACRSPCGASSSLRVRRGSWLVHVPCVYSGMCTLCSHTSSSDIWPKPSVSDARPARSDFTSVPVSTRPASYDLLDVVVVPGAPVPGDHFQALLGCHWSPVRWARSRPAGSGGASGTTWRRSSTTPMIIASTMTSTRSVVLSWTLKGKYCCSVSSQSDLTRNQQRRPRPASRTGPRSCPRPGTAAERRSSTRRPGA